MFAVVIMVRGVVVVIVFLVHVMVDVRVLMVKLMVASTVVVAVTIDIMEYSVLPVLAIIIINVILRD